MGKNGRGGGEANNISYVWMKRSREKG